MEKTPCPKDEVVYVRRKRIWKPARAQSRSLTACTAACLSRIGYCNGNNYLLNAVEYHRDSEINIAVTDMILILGKEQDITPEQTYDSSKMEAFLVPAGTVIEVYATTLHYAPCNVAESGFKAVVVLPKGTNTDLDPYTKATKEDDLLFARNKWLLSHPDAKIEGSVAGIQGENLSVR